MSLERDAAGVDFETEAPRHLGIGLGHGQLTHAALDGEEQKCDRDGDAQGQAEDRED